MNQSDWDKALKAMPDTYQIITCIERYSIPTRQGPIPRERVYARALSVEGVVVFSQSLASQASPPKAS